MRLAQAAEDAANQRIAGPRIEAQAMASRIVLDQLETWHQAILDTTNLDPSAETRGAAIWLVAGRCLGLAEAMWAQVRAGIDNEVLVTGRAIHEAARIVYALGDPEEDDLLRVWLDDEDKYRWVRPKAAREAHDRFQEKLADAMEREGQNRLKSTLALNEELYDRLSRTAHSRRSSCINSYWPDGRRFTYGTHPSPLRRAAATEWAGSMTVEVALSVGDALSGFYGRQFFPTNVRPLIESIEAIRRDQPLGEEAIRAAAGTDQD
jgi:hypothetical protein